MSKEIWKASKHGSFSKDYKLKDQINAASGSTMDNIADGFGRAGRAEFVNFYLLRRGQMMKPSRNYLGFLTGNT